MKKKKTYFYQYQRSQKRKRKKTLGNLCNKDTRYVLASYVIPWDIQQKRKRKVKKITLRRIRTTHLLLSGQMSYPVRLEGHHNIRLTLEP